jgi:PAS domain-containing protein
MEIALHIGANCTEGERLLRSLLRNADRLAEAGIAVPEPGRYRPALRSAVLAQMRGQGAAEARDLLLDAMLDGHDPRRLVLSNSAFMALPPWAMEGGFLHSAGPKLRAAGQIFAEDRVEAFVAIRNPATWLPAVFAQSRGPSFEEFTGGADPLSLRWSDLVGRLREAAPAMPLTVWCNEDAVLVWGEVMARLAGLPPGEALEGRFDLMAAVAVEEGMERFGRYVAQHPGQTPAQERRVVGAFLGKYAIPDRVEEEVSVPGWDAGLVEEVTRRYEADLDVLARMDGVTLVAP